MKNKKIRIALVNHDMTQYELAKLLNISESTMWRKLRFELPEEEQDAIVKVIEDREEEV